MIVLSILENDKNVLIQVQTVRRDVKLMTSGRSPQFGMSRRSASPFVSAAPDQSNRFWVSTVERIWHV